MEIQTFTTGKTLLLGDRQQITLIEQSNGLYSLDGETFKKDSKKLFISTTNSKSGFIVKKILTEREPEMPPLPDFDEDGDIIDNRASPPLPHLPEELKTFKIDNMVNFLKKLPTDVTNIIEKMATSPTITLEAYIKKKAEYLPSLYHREQERDRFGLLSSHPEENEEYWGIYLNVPYNQKNEVKKLGCRFDGGNKKWYIPYRSCRHYKNNINNKTTETIIKKWGIDTENIVYRYTPEYIVLSDQAKKLITSKDILFDNEYYKKWYKKNKNTLSYITDCHMLPDNANYYKFQRENERLLDIKHKCDVCEEMYTIRNTAEHNAIHTAMESDDEL